MSAITSGTHISLIPGEKIKKERGENIVPRRNSLESCGTEAPGKFKIMDKFKIIPDAA